MQNAVIISLFIVHFLTSVEQQIMQIFALQCHDTSDDVWKLHVVLCYEMFIFV